MNYVANRYATPLTNMALPPCTEAPPPPPPSGRPDLARDRQTASRMNFTSGPFTGFNGFTPALNPMNMSPLSLMRGMSSALANASMGLMGQGTASPFAQPFYPSSNGLNGMPWSNPMVPQMGRFFGLPYSAAQFHQGFAQQQQIAQTFGTPASWFTSFQQMFGSVYQPPSGQPIAQQFGIPLMHPDCSCAQQIPRMQLPQALKQPLSAPGKPGQQVPGMPLQQVVTQPMPAAPGNVSQQLAPQSAPPVKPQSPLPPAPSAGAPSTGNLKLGNDLASRLVKYMQKKGYKFSTQNGAKNVVYVEGMNANGVLNDNKPNVFNDRRMVIEFENGKPKIIHNAEATTEPSTKYTMNPMNLKGTARIEFGQYTSWKIGTHGGKQPHESLVQVAPLTVARDTNKDFKRNGDKRDTGLFGINQHWGYDVSSNNIANTSAGCLVGRTRAEHRQFMAVLKKDPRYQSNKNFLFTSTVIDGKDIMRELTFA